jgi:hypothetical protein
VGRGVEWLKRRLVSWPRVVDVPPNFVGERVRRERRNVRLAPFGLRLEEHLHYRVWIGCLTWRSCLVRCRIRGFWRLWRHCGGGGWPPA